ncbi:Mif2/CENP-C like-domain-containing protein [Coprinopsis sp. MPI-PUGE-AT-0042]|nr:Mif2/CENP-C like-domain-containing protein [Coprinopsis sp. MPI-PUGE-AT-0042]
MGSLTPSPNGSGFSFENIFPEGKFIAAGQMVIPPNGTKSEKSTKDLVYILYVIEGTVSVKIHETPLVIAAGGMFMIPRGNTYSIENISQSDARLFFTQTRKMRNDHEEEAVVLRRKQKEMNRNRNRYGPANHGEGSRGGTARR